MSALNFFLHLFVASLLCPSIETRLVVIFIVFHVAGCNCEAIQLFTHNASCNRKLPSIRKNCARTSATCSSGSSNSSNILSRVFRKIEYYGMIYRRFIKIHSTSSAVSTVYVKMNSLGEKDIEVEHITVQRRG